jgi:hypothetical protein
MQYVPGSVQTDPKLAQGTPVDTLMLNAHSIVDEPGSTGEHTIPGVEPFAGVEP